MSEAGTSAGHDQLDVMQRDLDTRVRAGCSITADDAQWAINEIRRLRQEQAEGAVTDEMVERAASKDNELAGVLGAAIHDGLRRDMRAILEAALGASQAKGTVSDDVRAKLLDLHKPYGIWEECEHNHDGADGAARYIDDVGLTCNKVYDICRECCSDGDGQNEACADGHNHGPNVPRCATVAILG